MYYSALLGKPVCHSVSPTLFEYLGNKANIEYRHIKIEVSTDELETTILALQRLKFIGCNITLPHKEVAATYADDASDIVKYCGATNLLTFNSGKVFADNTDWIGIRDSVQNKLQGISLNKALVFGTGGASRAAIYALQNIGVDKIVVLYQDPISNKTDKLIKSSANKNVTFEDYSNSIGRINEAEIILNMTSAGMKGMDRFPIGLENMEIADYEQKIFFDAVFNPVKTPLVTYFEQCGSLIIDGLWMMIYQGIAAFNSWTKIEVDLSPSELDELHQILVDAVNYV